MALTPEDVVNKRFQPTKFREGYDQDEVDDFLDEVVVELRRLNQENEELRQRLIAGESRIAELQRSASSQAAAPVAAAPAPAAPVEQPQFAAPPVVAAAAPAVAAYPAPTESVDPSNTNNLLQLARKLHEEHVREGIEKRDALIAEGHATAAKVVSDAEATAQAQIAEAEAASKAQLAEAEATSKAQLAEAEAAQKEQLATLEAERATLESRIDELRNFERDYRQKLRSYIEGQLADLDAPVAASAPASSSPAPQTPSAPFSAVPAPQPAGGFQGFGGN